MSTDVSEPLSKFLDCLNPWVSWSRPSAFELSLFQALSHGGKFQNMLNHYKRIFWSCKKYLFIFCKKLFFNNLFWAFFLFTMGDPRQGKSQGNQDKRSPRYWSIGRELPSIWSTSKSTLEPSQNTGKAVNRKPSSHDKNPSL